MEGKRTQAEKLAVIAAGVGAVILIIGFFLFVWHEKFSLQQIIKSDKVGQLGDFIGGVVGSFWALAGVLLFYAALKSQQKQLATQIEELHEQKKELALSREEFQTTRISNIIFKQIERIDNTIKELKFKSALPLTGQMGISNLDKYFQDKNAEILKYTDKNDDYVINRTGKIRALNDVEHVAINNQESIITLYTLIYDSTYIVLNLVDNSTLKKDVKLLLKQIFSNNIRVETYNLFDSTLEGLYFCCDNTQGITIPQGVLEQMRGKIKDKIENWRDV